MKWGNIYREKLKGVNKNPQDYEEEELLQQEKWCALAEILDEYEEKIEELQKENEDLKYEVRRLIDGHPSREGYKMMSTIMENS